MLHTVPLTMDKMTACDIEVITLQVLFWFTLTALLSLSSSSRRQLFSLKILLKTRCRQLTLAASRAKAFIKWPET